MASKGSGPQDLPPYLKIDPGFAAKRLADPIETSRFAKAAAFAGRGRDDLARRGYAPDGNKRLRKFSIWEITRYLIPVAPAHFRRVLKANPELPQGEGEQRLEDVDVGVFLLVGLEQRVDALLRGLPVVGRDLLDLLVQELTGRLDRRFGRG